MSGAANCPETPRQKMIGMMYLVLTAMLALNVSAEILNGFKMVNDSLRNTLETSEVKNASLYDAFNDVVNMNKGKSEDAKKRADILKQKTDSIYTFIENLKMDIAVATDGLDQATLDSLKNPGNLDAAGQIGIVGGKGKELKALLEDYSTTLQSLVSDSTMRMQFQQMFATEKKKGMSWEYQIFESMPAAATTTVLSKIQNDIKNSEAEVIGYLRNQIGADDIRVNKIEAMVIPNSKYVVTGGKYSAQIILAAYDSTAQPRVVIDGRDIEGGKYEVPASAVGNRAYKGTVYMMKDGKEIPYTFESDYIVTPQSITVSADLMNVFYAGFDNPVSISVPGVAQSQINASASGGTFTRKGDGWIIKPSKVGQDIDISVTATIDGRAQSFGKKTFRVKKLPDPVALIEIKDANGNPMKYKGRGNETIMKGALVEAPGIKAELDDADLDVRYRITSFDTNAPGPMGTISYPSDGPRFSARQKQQLRDLTKGKAFFLTNIKAMGPDGIERNLSPIEIKLR